MCVILDNSARDNVFGRGRTPAGEWFFKWLEEPQARLVVGGKLYDELAGSAAFTKWSATAIKDGRVRVFRRKEVERETASLTERWLGKSDDEHVIALARLSRARVLYANDGDLRDDFRNTALISKPRGRLYPVNETATAPRRRRALLNQSDLCPNR